MFTNVNRIKILSRKPLWYIDEGGKIGYIQNVYSDAEQIQVIKDDHITNYPICKNLTVIPELNTVLFETEEDAITGVAMMEDSENQDLMIQNGIQINMHETDCYRTRANSINSGLYSYSDFDSQLNNINAMEIRYLDHNEKIKMVHGSNENNELNNILTEYIKYEDIKSKHHDVKSERLIFDIISENGNVFIKSFWVNDNGIDVGPIPFMISPLTGYLMFNSKPNAAYYRNDVREGLTTPFISMVREGQTRSYNGYVRNEIKERKKEGIKTIVSGVKDLVLNLVSIDQIFGFLTDKTAPNIVRAYKRFARKRNDKKRKNNWLKTQEKK